jgi:protein-arginine kinase activator protein McsA
MDRRLDDRTYTINMVCVNCGHTFTNHVEKGSLAPTLATCPNCECETAHQLLGAPTRGKPRYTIHISRATDDARV